LVFAQCVKQSADPGTGNATISLNSWMPLNQVIGPWISITHIYACGQDVYPPISYPSLIKTYLYAQPPPGTALGGVTSVDGINYRIFVPQNQSKIGYIVRMRMNDIISYNVTSTNWASQSSLNRTSLLAMNPMVTGGGMDYGSRVSIEIQIRLVKINAAWPPGGNSTINFSASQPEVEIKWWSGRHWATLGYTARANVTFNVTTRSCTTPSVIGSGNSTVQLGNDIAYGNFNGPGTAAPSVPFTLRVQCSAGWTQGVRYRFHACPTCNTPPNNSTLPMGSGATAQGIGVQILNNNSMPLAFNTNLNLSGYNSNTGGTYNIPLRARVIQTCTCPNNQPNCHNHHNCVVPGTVRASMIMQMVYP